MEQSVNFRRWGINEQELRDFLKLLPAQGMTREERGACNQLIRKKINDIPTPMLIELAYPEMGDVVSDQRRQFYQKFLEMRLNGSLLSTQDLALLHIRLFHRDLGHRLRAKVYAMLLQSLASASSSDAIDAINIAVSDSRFGQTLGLEDFLRSRDDRDDIVRGLTEDARAEIAGRLRNIQGSDFVQ